MVKKIAKLLCLDFTEIDHELKKLRELSDSFARIGIPVEECHKFGSDDYGTGKDAGF